jgi:hypothetical protein
MSAAKSYRSHTEDTEDVQEVAVKAPGFGCRAARTPQVDASDICSTGARNSKRVAPEPSRAQIRYRRAMPVEAHHTAREDASAIAYDLAIVRTGEHCSRLHMSACARALDEYVAV